MTTNTLKPKRGFAKEFRSLKDKLKWLQSDLNHMVVRGEDCTPIRDEIKRVIVQLRSISE